MKKTKHFFLILFLLQSIFSYASIDTENNQARYEIGRLIVPISTLSVPAVGVATKLGRIKNVLKGLKKLSKPKKTKFFDEVTKKRTIGKEIKTPTGYVGDLLKHPLRIAYEKEVFNLKNVGERLIIAGGKSKETIARELHKARRLLGVKYKDATPSDLREFIYRMNKKDYGDELGPTIEWLISKDKNWDDIIESASRPGGRFNRQNLLNKFPSEHDKLVPILDKYEIK